MARKLTTYARELRKHSTDAERLFWSRVRDRRLAGFKFKRQLVKRHYIVDFICREAHLIVEIDGGQHAENAVDVIRDRLLNRDGYRVLRFWNNELLTNIDGVLEAVLCALRESGACFPSPSLPHPNPLPDPGEGTRVRTALLCEPEQEKKLIPNRE